MSSKYVVLLDHIANFLIFLSDAPSFSGFHSILAMTIADSAIIDTVN